MQCTYLSRVKQPINTNLNPFRLIPRTQNHKKQELIKFQIKYKREVSSAKAHLDSSALNTGPIGCTETIKRNCHYSLRNSPEEGSSHILRGGSLKSRNELLKYTCRITRLGHAKTQYWIGVRARSVDKSLALFHSTICNSFSWHDPEHIIGSLRYRHLLTCRVTCRSLIKK